LNAAGNDPSDSQDERYRIEGSDLIITPLDESDEPLDFKIKAETPTQEEIIDSQSETFCDGDSNNFELSESFESMITLELIKNEGFSTLITQDDAFMFERTDPNRCGVGEVIFLHMNDSVIEEGHLLYDKLLLDNQTVDSPVIFDSDEPLTDGFVVNKFYNFKYQVITEGGQEFVKEFQVKVVICRDETLSLTDASLLEYELYLDSPQGD